MKAIILTPQQRSAIDSAANSLLPSLREAFLDGIARRLGNEPTDYAVTEAINAQLAINRIPTFVYGAK